MSELVIGMDVGSTTVKAVVIRPDTKQILWSDYQRHHTKQPEKVLELLAWHVETGKIDCIVVETMTRDHLTPAQKAIGGFFPDDFVARGWGFGVGVVTRGDDPSAPVGQYGWDGGLGTIWRNDPHEQLAAVLLTSAAWSSPNPPPVARDFLTAIYAALAD